MQVRKRRPLLILVAACTLLLSLVNGLHPILGSVEAVVTNRYDNLRSGANLSETVLNTSNVTPSTFGKLFTRSVEGDIYASPLYVSSVTIPGRGTHNVIYVTTAHNMVYAFDADDPTPAGNVPLWQRDLRPLGPTFADNLDPDDVWDLEMGILSTPVIDLASQTMYFVSQHACGDGCGVFYVHALDITTGGDKVPIAKVQAEVHGKGDGNVDGVISFDGYYQLQRPGLLLLNGRLYIAFGSTGDFKPFHGWIMAYDASTLQQVAVFNSTPDGGEGGIWQSGTGISTDGTSLYAVTGNGTFDANTPGGRDYGQSILRLNQDLSATNYFTPYDQVETSLADLDLGINGAMLLPGTTLAISGSKAGILYIVNRDNMGGYQADADSQIVQSFSPAQGFMHSTPVFWDGPDGLILYIWTERDYPKGFSFNGQTLDTAPVLTGQVTTEGMPAGILSLSADGNHPGTGIVWGTHMLGENPKGIGVLHAFDAAVYPDGVMREIWNSEMNPERDEVGIIAKFNPPVVANGKVYVASFSNVLDVYGLLPATSQEAPNRGETLGTNTPP
jgi:hypothetical protein